MLPPPLRMRKEIPFYYDKKEEDFRRDPYEHYANMVARQMRLHLVTSPYPFQQINDFIIKNLPKENLKNIADIGCGVGKLVGTIAQQFPNSNCYGVDYSYQLLKVANDYWVKGKEIQVDDKARGFNAKKIAGLKLKNVQFLLAKAEDLPSSNSSLSAICSSFALDRFEQPRVALQEFYRCLTNEGRAIICSPLNFQQQKHWEEFYPFKSLIKSCSAIGFDVIKWEEKLEVIEPLDFHGNTILWKVFGIVLEKNKKAIAKYHRLSNKSRLFSTFYCLMHCICCKILPLSSRRITKYIPFCQPAKLNSSLVD